MQRTHLRKYIFRVIAIGMLVGVAPTIQSSCLFVECYADSDCLSFEYCDTEEGLCEEGTNYSSGSGSSGPTCAADTEDCSTMACCSSDYTCVDYDSLGPTCAADCVVNNDCVGRCCINTQQGSQVCAPSSYCN